MTAALFYTKLSFIKFVQNNLTSDNVYVHYIEVFIDVLHLDKP